MRRLAKWVRKWLSVPHKVEVDNVYRQLESVVAIYNLLEHNFALGPLRDWAISPDALRIVLVDIAIRRPQNVVEFGSGQSTIAIAKLLTAFGGRLTSFEHDGDYFRHIHDSLALFALQDTVSPIIRPLRAIAEDQTTYDFSELQDVKPEVVLVDGPPGGRRNRLAPLRWAYNNIPAGGVIYLDDYGREEEQACVRQLRQEFPDLVLTARPTEKQMAVIEKPIC